MTESLEKRLAFIGLGNMGLPMAVNLKKAGFRLQGYDIGEAACARAAGVGLNLTPDLATAIQGVGAVISMLPGSREALALYKGEGGIFQTLPPGTLVIDCSTIAVEAAKELATAAEEAGLHFLDAPVSGGVAGAEKAALTFMVGGQAEVLAQATPILEKLGKRIIHAGLAGSGQIAKLCNNMILGISMIAVAEAFTLGARLGIDQKTLFEIVANSSGSCWALLNHHPVPGLVPTSAANSDYKPGFATAIMHKDLLLSQEAAAASGAATPVGALATALFALHKNQGGSDKDYSSIITLLQGVP